MANRHNIHIVRAFAEGKRIFWRFVEAPKYPGQIHSWNEYDDSGPLLGDTVHSKTIPESIEWKIGEQTKRSVNKIIIEAFASGKDVEWRSKNENSPTRDWRIYEGGIALGMEISPFSPVEWRVKNG